jgi:hypothetical protein
LDLFSILSDFYRYYSDRSSNSRLGVASWGEVARDIISTAPFSAVSYLILDYAVVDSGMLKQQQLEMEFEEKRSIVMLRWLVG